MALDRYSKLDQDLLPGVTLRGNEVQGVGKPESIDGETSGRGELARQAVNVESMLPESMPADRRRLDEWRITMKIPEVSFGAASCHCAMTTRGTKRRLEVVHHPRGPDRRLP